MSPLASLVHWFQGHSILVMLAIFMVMSAWVYAPSRKRSMERYAHIPLDDDEG